MKNNMNSLSFSFLLILLASCSFLKAYAINPQKKYVATPEVIGIKYNTYKIKVDDSITLNSWACLQEDLKKPFIIISGADAGNMANCLGQAQGLFEAGYNVMMYDYRGFGESSDFEINKDMMYYSEFAKDLEATISFVKDQFGTDKIVLYGLSMGTIVSKMNLYSDKAIKGMILDSFVIDPNLVVERISKAKNKKVLLPKDASGYAKSNEKELTKPALIFSGVKDDFTKTNDYDGFLAKNSKAKIITWDCGHLESYFSMGENPNQYIVEVKKFISTL